MTQWSAGIQADVPSPEPPTLNSPFTALFHSAQGEWLHLKLCVFWPFKRMSAFTAVSLWLRETLLLSSSGSLGWGAQVGV